MVKTPSHNPPANPQDPMRNALITLAIGLLLLVGLFWLFKPGAAPTPTPAVAAGAAEPLAAVADPVPAPAPAPAVARLELQIAEGRLLGEPQSYRLSQGAQVELQLRSDRAGELHLHGYDLEAKVQPGLPTLLSFRADHAGRFEMELHSKAGHIDLGALEVQPQ